MKLIFWLTGNEYLGGCVSLTNGASFVHSMYKEGCRRDTFAWQTLRDCENLEGMRQRRKRESRLERNPFVYPKYNLIKTQYFWALHIFSTLIHSKRQSNFIHSFKTKSNFMFSFK